MRCVGNQVARGIKQRAAEVQPLLDIDRVRGVLQLQAHLLGNVHEQVVEHFEEYRVNRRTCCKFNSTLRPSVQHQVVKRCQVCLPAGLNDRRCILLGNDGRARDDVAGLKVFAHHQRRIVPLPARIHAHCLAAWHFTRLVRGMARLCGRVTCNH